MHYIRHLQIDLYFRVLFAKWENDCGSFKENDKTRKGTSLESLIRFKFCFVFYDFLMAITDPSFFVSFFFPRKLPLVCRGNIALPLRQRF